MDQLLVQTHNESQAGGGGAAKGAGASGKAVFLALVTQLERRSTNKRILCPKWLLCKLLIGVIWCVCAETRRREKEGNKHFTASGWTKLNVSVFDSASSCWEMMLHPHNCNFNSAVKLMVLEAVYYLSVNELLSMMRCLVARGLLYSTRLL